MDGVFWGDAIISRRWVWESAKEGWLFGRGEVRASVVAISVW